MTELTGGIRVAFEVASPDSGEPRLLLNDGTRRVTNWHAGGIPYNSPAFLPASSWRAATERERQLLVAPSTEPADVASTIWVIKMSDSFMKPLEPYRKHFAGSRAECESVRDTPGYFDAQRQAVLELGPYLRSSERIRLLGTCVNEPGLTTCTTYSVKGVKRFAGLHVDDWDRAPMAERTRCRSKISINVGWEDRFFLFINRPIVELLGGVLVEGNDKQPGRDFMERYPHYPVVRLRIRPGEGYIAPTDNMVHDGSTEGMERADVTVNLLGHAGPAR
jgi:hypothetical protein